MSAQNGIIFDIKEFSVHDGPGIRTTIFLKGCPLRCTWCHNPEGQSRQPQVMRGPAGDRLAGREYSPEALAAVLNRQGIIFKANEGGVTFSGGEPLLQTDFLLAVIERLDGLHVLLDTCGYGDPADLRRLLARVNMVYYDLKLINPAAHRRYTGVDNELILRNLDALGESGVPFVIRVPLVPGVTDRDENLAATAERVQKLRGSSGLPGEPGSRLLRVDLLPYNRAAGAKYAAAGMVFKPDYDEARPVNANTALFERLGVKVRVA